MKKIAFIIIATTIMLAGATLAYAQTQGAGGYVPLSPLPGTTAGNSGSTDINTYLVGLFKLLIGIAGALAVVMIIIGGIQYMSTDAIYGKEDGKEKIKSALGGLLLAIVSWLLLQSINPKLLNINATIEPTNAPTNTQSSSQTTNEQCDGNTTSC